MRALPLLPLLQLRTVLAVLLHVVDASRVAGDESPVARERWLGRSRRRPSCLCNTFCYTTRMRFSQPYAALSAVCALVSRMRLS
jgi:hypothetical protein